MHFPVALLLFTSTANTLAIVSRDVALQPSITNITYWGSACPENGGLSFTLGSSTSANSSTTSLAFTLSNFLPNFGSFGSSLRMCNAVAFLQIGKGWRLRVNEKGTTATGEARLPGNATMYLRGTYMFAEPPFNQSIGMLDVPGPLEGRFDKLLTPVEGNERGVEGSCEGGETELDIEFQARAVNDTYGYTQELDESAAGTNWTLTTGVEVVKC